MKVKNTTILFLLTCFIYTDFMQSGMYSRRKSQPSLENTVGNLKEALRDASSTGTNVDNLPNAIEQFCLTALTPPHNTQKDAEALTDVIMNILSIINSKDIKSQMSVLSELLTGSFYTEDEETGEAKELNAGLQYNQLSVILAFFIIFIKVYEETLITSQQQLTTTTADLATATTDLTQARSDLAKMQASMDQLMEQAREAIGGKTGENETLTRQVTQLQAMIEAYKTQLAAAQHATMEARKAATPSASEAALNVLATVGTKAGVDLFTQGAQGIGNWWSTPKTTTEQPAPTKKPTPITNPFDKKPPTTSKPSPTNPFSASNPFGTSTTSVKTTPVKKGNESPF